MGQKRNENMVLKKWSDYLKSNNAACQKDAESCNCKKDKQEADIKKIIYETYFNYVEKVINDDYYNCIEKIINDYCSNYTDAIKNDGKFEIKIDFKDNIKDNCGRKVNVYVNDKIKEISNDYAEKLTNYMNALKENLSKARQELTEKLKTKNLVQEKICNDEHSSKDNDKHLLNLDKEPKEWHISLYYNHKGLGVKYKYLGSHYSTYTEAVDYGDEITKLYFESQNIKMDDIENYSTVVTPYKEE